MTPRLSTLEAIEEALHAQLARATADRHHEWRTPVLATVRAAPELHADACTVVLRESSTTGFVFLTDARSPKVEQLTRAPRGTLVFWSPRLGWQLRVAVALAVRTTGERVEARRRRVLAGAASRDYRSVSTPGAKLAEPGPAPLGEEAHFALLEAVILEMDWLELAAEGHRRARFGASGASWLVP